MKSIHPVTGDVVREVEDHDDAEVERRVRAAHDAFREWRRTGFEERAGPLRRAASLLRERRGELAALMAEEMGKPVTQGASEAEKCAWVCEFYAENAARFLAEEPVETDAAESFVAYRPLGVVLGVMPWNFPFWQVFRYAAPTLMAGNGALLKHAANVPGCALAIERLLRDAGLPAGLFATLLVESDRVGDVIAHPAVAAVTLTGSVSAGRAVASRAGEHLKKVVLELGGSDPYVILDDADLEAAAATCAKSRLINSGQSCIAAKRFVVTEQRRPRFEGLLVEAMDAARVGDPTREETEVGPLARHDLRDALHRQVTASAERGARVLLGAQVPDDPGAFYPPSVLTDVHPGMPAHDEELFGPVAAVVPVPNEAEAIRAANDSRFGLGAAVFTSDVERGRRLATDELEAGACFVNDHVKSDPRLPFGGIRESGYGRELAAFGIREFVNVKTVSVG